MGCCAWKAADRQDRVSPRHGADTVAQHRAAAEAALMAATGGKPLCRVDDDRPIAAKCAEGRLAAIAEVQRRARSLGGDLAIAARLVLAAWRASDIAAPEQAAAWSGYRRGGVDELEALVDDLTSLCSNPGSAGPR